MIVEPRRPSPRRKIDAFTTKALRTHGCHQPGIDGGSTVQGIGEGADHDGNGGFGGMHYIFRRFAAADTLSAAALPVQLVFAAILAEPIDEKGNLSFNACTAESRDRL